ncbi:MAG: hypothetical protein LBB55_04425 [Zoogloeaceae bacterium]|jgi:hypothetical protein|nr:hypothetical protein [Zoogloeaceae bacterium]
MSNTQYIAEARKRLLGTWHSDAERTMSEWVFPKRLAAKRYKWFKSIFGKNTWRFTDTHCTDEFEGENIVSTYRILWADEWSAVVVPGKGKKQTCHHLFFDGEHFYFSAGRAGNVEYFKHVEEPNIDTCRTGKES